MTVIIDLYVTFFTFVISSLSASVLYPQLSLTFIPPSNTFFFPPVGLVAPQL